MKFSSPQPEMARQDRLGVLPADRPGFVYIGGAVVSPEGNLGGQVAVGQPLEEAVIHDFLQDQPMAKFPYFTMGEVNVEQIREFNARCNAMTYTP